MGLQGSEFKSLAVKGLRGSGFRTTGRAGLKRWQRFDQQKRDRAFTPLAAEKDMSPKALNPKTQNPKTPKP